MALTSSSVRTKQIKWQVNESQTTHDHMTSVFLMWQIIPQCNRCAKMLLKWLGSQCHWLHAVWGMVRGVVGTCMNWWPGMRPGTRDRFHWLCAVVIIDWRRVRCMMRTIRQWEDHLSPCAQTVSNHLLLPLPVGLNLSFPWEITTMYLHRHTRAATISYHYWLNDCLVDFYAELQSAGERETSQCVETHRVIPRTWL